jgi:hypothetical protein
MVSINSKTEHALVSEFISRLRAVNVSPVELEFLTITLELSIQEINEGEGFSNLSFIANPDSWLKVVKDN